MKSAIFAMICAMLASALYAFQNMEEVTVSFLWMHKSFPQGIWEVILFCGGAFLMWICSFFSMAEQRRKYRRQLDAQNDHIRSIEKDKQSIIETITSVSKSGETVASDVSSVSPGDGVKRGEGEAAE